MKIAERFQRRFSGLVRAHGVYIIDEKKRTKKNKVLGKARTLKEPVTLEKWEAHLNGETGIGIVPIDENNVCVFGAIDIDMYDLNLEVLEKNVRDGGFPLVTCRTKSGGAHLYAFFSEPVAAEIVKDLLLEWSIALGYPKSEVFPKQSELRGEDDIGNWINMPYFAGDRTTRYAISDGNSLTMEQFLNHADELSVSKKGFVNFKVEQDPRLNGGPPCLQHLARAGFPEGTRNKALFNLGVLCRLKYGDEWKKKLDEFNRRYLLPPLSSAEVKVLISSLSKKSYFYTCKEPPLVDACNRNTCLKRKFGIGGSSHDLGVTLDGLMKIKTNPPTWILNVDGKRVYLETTLDLVEQGRFIQRAMEVLNVLPRRVSRPVWDEMIRGLLKKVEEVSAPQDAGVVGQFAFLLEQFCTERVPAKNKEELLLGKPYTEEGYVYFRSADMLSYINKHKLSINAKDAWNILRDRDARTERFKVKGRTIRCWGIPVIPCQTESFDVPDVQDEKEDF